MARTLMARLPWLFQTHSWVPWKKSHSCRCGIIQGVFLIHIENGILCVLIRITSMRQFYWEHTIYLHVTENWKDIPILTPDLALWLTLISSAYLCLEHIFMVPKVFEPLKFYCIVNWVTHILKEQLLCWLGYHILPLTHYLTGAVDL